jgi:uncharacterized membrane protein
MPISSKSSKKYSILRTIIFTTGHFCIDISTNYIITGAPLALVAISAGISPILNACWYYILDRLFFAKVLKLHSKNNHIL